MQNSVRKSLRISRVPNIGGSSNGTLQRKKHQSLRKSLRNISMMTSGTGPADALILLGDPDFAVSQGDMKPARVQKVNFFANDDAQEVVGVKSNVELRIHGSNNKKKKSSFRASLMKPKKQNAELSVGDGRIIFKVGSSISYKFEIGHVDHLHLASSKTKDVSLTFRDDDRLFTFKCESAAIAQDFSRQILIEARQMCHVLEKALTKLIPEDWAKVLQTNSLMLSAETSAVTSLTVLEANEETLIDLVLREIVDLTAFARGYENNEYVDECERFAKWLQKRNREEEYVYWEEFVIKRRQVHDAKLERELGDGQFLGQRIDIRHGALDEIRNPIQMEDVANLRNKSIPKNLDSRLERVEAGLQRFQNGLQSGDHTFDCLI